MHFCTPPEFHDEFEFALRHIEAEPERWPKIRGDDRKLKLRRFPCAVDYSVGPDVIRLKAVMHPHRRPGYWRHR